MISTEGLTQEKKVENINGQLIPLNLELPIPEVIENRVVFEPEAYSIMLQIYEVYNNYLFTKKRYEEIIDQYDRELVIYQDRLEIKNETLKILTLEKEQTYKLLNSQIGILEKNKRKNKIRTVIIAASSGVVGISIGILFGILVIK